MSWIDATIDAVYGGQTTLQWARSCGRWLADLRGRRQIPRDAARARVVSTALLRDPKDLHPGGRAPPKRACMRAARQDGRGTAAAHIRRAARAGAARTEAARTPVGLSAQQQQDWRAVVALEEAICAGAAGGDSGGGECRVGFRKSGEDARKEGAEGC